MRCEILNIEAKEVAFIGITSISYKREGRGGGIYEVTIFYDALARNKLIFYFKFYTTCIKLMNTCIV